MTYPVSRRMVGRLRNARSQADDARPPPGTYREFNFSPGAITAAAGTFRDRGALTAPESGYRCVELAVRNVSAEDVIVTFPNGETHIVTTGTTDIVNRGQTFIENYSLSVSNDVADGEVLITEKCRSWAGWNRGAQEG